MTLKTTKLTGLQLESFRKYGSAFASCATLSFSGTYPQELINCGINERDTSRNILVGYNVTQPSGSQLALETVYFDQEDREDNGDLHVVNFKSGEIISHYRGWGTWTQYYGNRHREFKAYLRPGTNT